RTGSPCSTSTRRRRLIRSAPMARRSATPSSGRASRSKRESPFSRPAPRPPSGSWRTLARSTTRRWSRAGTSTAPRASCTRSTGTGRPWCASACTGLLQRRLAPRPRCGCAPSFPSTRSSAPSGGTTWPNTTWTRWEARGGTSSAPRSRSVARCGKARRTSITPSRQRCSRACRSRRCCPHRLRPATSADAQHHFAERATLLHQAVGVGDLLEREHLVDDRLHLRGNERPHACPDVSDDLGALCERPGAQRGPGNGEAPAQQVSEVQLGYGSALQTDDHERAAVLEGCQVALEVLTADAVEHQVHAAVVGNDLREVGGAVVDSDIRAKVAALC